VRAKPGQKEASENIKGQVRINFSYNANKGPVRFQYTVNVWFPLMYSQKSTVQPLYFQNRIIMFCVSLGIFKSLTDT
jgi:hypothetical protein